MISGDDSTWRAASGRLVPPTVLDRGAFQGQQPRFHLKLVRIGSPERLTRLLLALTIALCWLALAALPESGALPPRWHAAVAAWGRARFLSHARALVDLFHNLPLPWLSASQ